METAPDLDRLSHSVFPFSTSLLWSSKTLLDCHTGKNACWITPLAPKGVNMSPSTPDLAPPPDGDVNKGPIVLSITYSTTAIALFVVSMRMWVRIRIVKSVGWDDYTILLAAVSYTASRVSNHTDHHHPPNSGNGDSRPSLGDHVGKPRQRTTFLLPLGIRQSPSIQMEPVNRTTQPDGVHVIPSLPMPLPPPNRQPPKGIQDIFMGTHLHHVGSYRCHHHQPPHQLQTHR